MDVFNDQGKEYYFLITYICINVCYLLIICIRTKYCWSCRRTIGKFFVYIIINTYSFYEYSNYTIVHNHATKSMFLLIIHKHSCCHHLFCLKTAHNTSPINRNFIFVDYFTTSKTLIKALACYTSFAVSSCK